MRKGRNRRPLLVLVLLLELVAASSALRSELFLKEPVNAAFNQLSERLGGRFSYDSITPAGLTGVAIGGLTFLPDGASREALSVKSLAVFPDLRALAEGRVAITSVEVSSLRAEVGDALSNRLEQWVRRCPDEPETAAPSSLVAMSAGAPSDRLPRVVHIDRADLTISNSALKSGTLAVQLESLRLDTRDDRGEPALAVSTQWEIDGFSRGGATAQWRPGVAPQFRVTTETAANWLDVVEAPVRLPNSASISARAIEMRGANDVVLEQVQATQLNAPIPGLDRWRVDELASERVVVRNSASNVSVSWGVGHIELAGLLERPRLAVLEGNARMERVSGDADAWFVLGEGERDRLEVAVARSARGDLALSAQARDYHVNDWSEFFADEAPIRLTSGRVTGEILASAPSGSAEASVSVRGAIEEGRVFVPLVASGALEEVTASLRGDITVTTQLNELHLNQGQITVGGVPVSLVGSYSWSEQAPRLILSAECTEGSAEQLRRGLPRGLAPSLDDTTLAGTLTASLGLDLNVGTPDESVVDLQLDVSNVRVMRFSKSAPIHRLDGDFVLEIPTHDGAGRTIGPSLTHWVALDDAGDYLASALISAEDGRFWSHDGFDWRAILASVENNLAERRIVRGGSTITQQVVRSLFLGRERTLSRKFEEAFLSWQLEQIASKERILELYINSVHWGPGVYGVREAAATYFRRPPSQLTVRESAFLASILSNPDYFGLQYARNIVPTSRREKICNVLRNMWNQGDIPRRTFEDECRAISDGEVSIVPVPTWLVDHEPPSSPPVASQTAQLSCE